MRHVSLDFRVHQPLVVTSRSTFVSNVSCVCVNVENISDRHDVVLYDLRFHLSSTRWASSANAVGGNSMHGTTHASTTTVASNSERDDLEDIALLSDEENETEQPQEME